MLLDLHFQIEAGELAQMAMRKRVLSPENRTHFKNAPVIGADTHLLMQLRRLGQASRLPLVIQGENRRPPFAGPGQQLRRVDLNEVVRHQVLTKELSSATGSKRMHWMGLQANLNMENCAQDEVTKYPAILSFRSKPPQHARECKLTMQTLD